MSYTDASQHLTPDDLIDVINGAVTEAEEKLMRQHLGTCDSCMDRFIGITDRAESGPDEGEEG